MLMVAIGHQAGLAIENTTFYNAKIQAERLAAVGQTIATLSHHIKNILQGIRGGSYLIDLGLNEKDETIVRRGWTIVEKNQTKIYNLVMDMLSFSKDREPALEPADLNETVGDVVELMQSRAEELGVQLISSPSSTMPRVMVDPEGIHRAVLNIVTNAIDASEGSADARVTVTTEWDAEKSTARIRIADNGVGIDEAEIGSIFQIFASSKGSRGTGLGLPVSRKIISEHGGSITVSSQPGQGADLPHRIAHDAEVRPQGNGRRPDHDGLNARPPWPRQSCPGIPTGFWQDPGRPGLVGLGRDSPILIPQFAGSRIPQFHGSHGLCQSTRFLCNFEGSFRGSFLIDVVRNRGLGNGPGEKLAKGCRPGGRNLSSLSQPHGSAPR